MVNKKLYKDMKSVECDALAKRSGEEFFVMSIKRIL